MKRAKRKAGVAGTMMRWAYAGAGAAVGAFTSLRSLVASGPARRKLRERQGLWDGHRRSAQPWIWIHSSSLGEAEIAVAVARALEPSAPGLRLVASAMTDSGLARLEHEHGIESRYFPIDFAPFVKKILEPLPPRLFVAVETEIWPETLRLLADKRVPVAIVNARLSEESVPRYRRIGPMLRPLLAGAVTRVCARDTESARRWISLGVPEARVRTMGNIKYDLSIPEEDLAVEPLFPRAPGSPTLLGASTHEGEEAIVLNAFTQVRKPVAASRLILAPRHVERAPAVVAQVRARGLVARTWSELEQADRTETWPMAIDVVVLDRFGLLRRAYAAATACFVGGSAVPGPGGHNLLEAASAGCPMAAGRHLGNVEDQADLLHRVGALRITDDAAALSSFWIEVIAIPEHFLDLVADAKAVVPERRGALERNVAALVPLLGSRRG